MCACWFLCKYSRWSGATDDSHNYRLSCPTAERLGGREAERERERGKGVCVGVHATVSVSVS